MHIKKEEKKKKKKKASTKDEQDHAILQIAVFSLQIPKQDRRQLPRQAVFESFISSSLADFLSPLQTTDKTSSICKGKKSETRVRIHFQYHSL
ncbi:hypothetical protein ANANG_G00312690 [Anguilla anguilla]|uniref:Uncharacterized protein n=1 Tax=Anguilla anguilla TaxID=7936 RepID=A0A9D3LLT6_ANGAN|nr:hypothetical protein ANANG_G00312690 [Anguilla anguilla]